MAFSQAEETRDSAYLASMEDLDGPVPSPPHMHKPTSKADFHTVDLDASGQHNDIGRYVDDDMKVATEAIRVGQMSFEVQQPEKANAPAGANKAAWYHATFHTVTAVVGAGVLGLPYAFSYLGWFGGLLMLLLAGLTSRYTSALMAEMHEENGKRYNRYRDLGEAVLGRTKSLLFIAPFQFIVMVGLGIAYMLTGGQSLRHIDYLLSPSVGSVLSLTEWIFIFALSQVLLSQIRDFHSLWWVSVVGALMSFGYSAIATVACAARIGEHSVSYAQRDSGADHVLGAFASVGTIMFSYGGHSVLLEIQATLKAPPDPKESMMKGVNLAYLVSAIAYVGVAVFGYAAFGNVVDSDVLISLRNPTWAIGLANAMVVLHVAASYQVYSMPVFETMETALQLHVPALANHDVAMRIVLRTVYVVLTAFTAALFPFFGDLMGFFGAVGFIPMTMVMPVVLWLVAKPDRPIAERVMHWAIVIVFTGLGVLALIGATWRISDKANTYQFFS